MNQYIEEAGAIVLRKNNGNTEVLLIFSKKKPRIRIFPKGHIEPGETPAEAAGRELLEEAGIEGELLGEAGVVTYEFREKWYRVIYFFFRNQICRSEGESGRSPEWFSLKDASNALSFNELRQLITAPSIERFQF
ncbi:MAG: NUDIX domain-containing protein [Chitinispirillaceae bacterium]|nr:NUDIX domain-containing protein [Chitinispirillaceae bacterium]